MKVGVWPSGAWPKGPRPGAWGVRLRGNDHCCATQLPIAPRSRLMGYGTWQHGPGTSHLLTHVLWCQLVLLIPY